MPHDLRQSLANNSKIWDEISRLVPHLAQTVQSIVLGLDIQARPACVYLRGMEKETARLEAAISRRFDKSLPVVIFKPTLGEPFDVEEEESLRGLFPMLTGEGLIRFEETI